MDWCPRVPSYRVWTLASFIEQSWGGGEEVKSKVISLTKYLLVLASFGEGMC